MAVLRGPCHPGKYRIRRIYRSAKFVPPTPRPIFLTILRSWRHREAFPRDCTHFLTRYRSRVRCRHLAVTGHCTPRAARRRVYECAAIRYWWLWGMVGVVLDTRSHAFAGCEGI